MKKKIVIGLTIVILLGIISFMFIEIKPDGSISFDIDGYYKRHFMDEDEFVNLEEEALKLETNSVAGKKLVSFEAEDLNGNKITEKLFKRNKLTMLHLWGTHCSKCIKEMPDLEKLYKEISKKDVNLVGIVTGVKEDENKKEAKNIVKKIGLTYTNIIPDKSLIDEIVSKFDYVPVSIFIDQEGNILKTHIAGANSYEEYLEIINEVLKDVGN
ncbi:TlpA family protein disulfide reductase [Abyssisolibacter fermentans]|uniref:TlpA family protein disulfide reductase n=1 Tax=Abyssisolibacter fermentans TaxID=1766203 RepID=UPI00082C2DE8|nr:TlpA disulfide reductase family protein [Abyssisolibacter fermentans]